MEAQRLEITSGGPTVPMREIISDANTVPVTSHPFIPDANTVPVTSHPFIPDANPVPVTSNPFIPDANPVPVTSHPFIPDASTAQAVNRDVFLPDAASLYTAIPYAAQQPREQGLDATFNGAANVFTRSSIDNIYDSNYIAQFNYYYKYYSDYYKYYDYYYSNFDYFQQLYQGNK